jgi:hypothetical protein
VQATRQWELAQLEEAFLSSSLERSANRALGVVENWKAHYPPPDSHAWKRVVLQAVGYGILGYLLSVAVPKLRGDSADFTMQAGVHSAADADALMASVTHLCEEVVPTLAWEEVAPDVHKALQRFTG